MTIYNKVISARWTARLCIVSIMMLTLFSFTASSQNTRRARRAAKAAAEMQADSTAAPVISDSLRAVMDSTFRADSIAAEDSVKLLKKSSLQAPAFTTAKDSIIEDFSDGKKTIYYYGDVSVTYGNMKLTADYMEYDLDSGILYARGTKDKDGVIQGKPVM